MDPSKWIDWVKLSPKYFFVFSLVLGLLLFGPNVLLEGLGAQSFVDKYRFIFGSIFLLCLVLFLVGFFGSVYKFWKKKYARMGVSRLQKKRLRDLTDREKDILIPYIANKDRNQVLEFNDGTVTELERLRIIYRSATVSRGGMYFDYNIQPWAWNYLNKHPHLLEKDDENHEETGF